MSVVPYAQAQGINGGSLARVKDSRQQDFYVTYREQPAGNEAPSGYTYPSLPVGSRQVVRQRPLEPPFGGSNPPSPASVYSFSFAIAPTFALTACK